MIVAVSLEDFKQAIRLKGYDSIAAWVRDQENPKGQKVDRTNVYKALQQGSPQWLLEKMQSIVKESRDKHPDIWD